MTAKAWLIIAIISFSLAALALIADVFIFVVMRMHTVIGDLTGRTVAKEVKSIKATNSYAGQSAAQKSVVNNSAVKYYDNKVGIKPAVLSGAPGNSADDSGRQASSAADSRSDSRKSRRMRPGKKETDVLREETDILREEADGTGVIGTDLLEPDKDGKEENLVEKYIGTAVLAENENPAEQPEESGPESAEVPQEPAYAPTAVLKEVPDEEFEDEPAEESDSRDKTMVLTEESDSPEDNADNSADQAESGAQPAEETGKKRAPTSVLTDENEKSDYDEKDKSGKTSVLEEADNPLSADPGTTVLAENPDEEKAVKKEVHFKVTKHSEVTHTDSAD